MHRDRERNADEYAKSIESPAPSFHEVENLASTSHTSIASHVHSRTSTMSQESEKMFLPYNEEFTDDEELEDDDYRDWDERADQNQYAMGEIVEETYKSGATKSTFHIDDQSSYAYQNDSSSCNVTVKKLIWADGWQAGSKISKPMTLVMLQLRFDPKDKGKVTYASFRLRLKSDRPGEEEPQVVAWGPFNDPEKWDAISVQKGTNRGRSLGAEFGFASQKVTGRLEGSETAAWEDESTEVGRSTAQSSKKMKQSKGINGLITPAMPSAVLWEVSQNEKRNQGINPQFRVGALFLRPTDAGHYKASLEIHARTSQAQSMLKRMGVGGDKVKWRVPVRPGIRDRCFFQGAGFIEHINLNNLDELRETANSQHFKDHFRDQLDSANDSKASSRPADTGGPVAVTVALAEPSAEGTGRDGGGSPLPRPSLQRSSEVDTPLAAVMPDSTSPGRMVALEARMGEDEGRIGRQDARIAVLEERIARLEKTLMRMAESLLQL